MRRAPWSQSSWQFGPQDPATDDDASMLFQLHLDERVTKLEEWKQDVDKDFTFRMEGFVKVQQKCHECHASRTPNKYWPLKEQLAELMIADLEPHLEH